MKRSLPLIVAAGLAAGVLTAQNTQEHRFYQAAEAFDRAQLKLVMQAVNDLDPAADVFESDDMLVLQVKGNPSVTDEQLRGAIASAGITVLPGTPDLKALYGEASLIPMYKDTGDPFNDHKRYVDAVNTWNSTNPDQPMPEPLPLYEDE
jgi:hypothetical protein